METYDLNDNFNLTVALSVMSFPQMYLAFVCSILVPLKTELYFR